ncbi:MAG: spore coat protein CotJB [Clostridiales bacterium]|nr:spore coat protein CotJB [Clostridiales bacterium]
MRNGNLNHQQLMKVIYEVDFALCDLVLYLDTHPDCQQALDLYRKYQEIWMQAMDEYQQYCGPLSSHHVNAANQWDWITGPWPWEREC